MVSKLIKERRLLLLIVLISGGILFCWLTRGQAEELLRQEVLIKVQPNIIAMPGNKVAKVPMQYARIRSTDLRQLMQQYNAVSIERVYEVQEIASGEGSTKYGALGKKDSRSDKFLKANAPKKRLKYAETLAETISPTEETVEVRDVFIITFADYINSEGTAVTVNIDAAISALAALPVVESAEKR